MREFKFKALDRHTKEWIYSDKEGLPLFWLSVVNGDLINVCQCLGIRDKKRTTEYPNGQEIYEGDIIVENSVGDKIWQDFPENVPIEQRGGVIEIAPAGVVYYKGVSFNVKTDRIGRVKLNKGGYSELYLACYDGVFNFDLDDIEIIGNLVHNSEILKGVKK